MASQNVPEHQTLSEYVRPENVMTACHRHARRTILDAVLRLPRFQRDESEHKDFALELLEIFDLARFRDEGGTSLPYGNQRRLEIVRALATRPQLLLLDEPAAGMNPSEQEDLMRLIKEIRDRFGLTILLVEHNMKVVMGVCDRIQVVDYEKSIALGLPQDIKNDPKVSKPTLEIAFGLCLRTRVNSKRQRPKTEPTDLHACLSTFQSARLIKRTGLVHVVGQVL